MQVKSQNKEKEKYLSDTQSTHTHIKRHIFGVLFNLLIPSRIKILSVCLKTDETNKTITCYPLKAQTFKFTKSELIF